MLVIALMVFGLCLGSFVNALVWRLHEQEGRPKGSHNRPKIKPSDLSIMKGRSMCVHCHHRLAVNDLIPVLSWLKLRGKCRYCKKPISWQYPLAELVVAALFVISYAAWPYELSVAAWLLFGLWLLALTAFTALVVYDLRWQLLPNRVVYPLIGVAVTDVLVRAIWIEGSSNLIIGSLLAVAATAGLFYVLFQASRGKWIGGGDVKLCIALGLFAGSLPKALLLLFLSSTIGTLVSLPLLAAGKVGRQSRIPFGPFLILATIIVRLFSEQIIRWYESRLLGF